MSYVTEPKKLKTRKKHVCWWCGQGLEKSEEVMCWRGVGNGPDNMYSIYMHPECFAAMMRAEAQGDDFADDLPFAYHERGKTLSEWEDEDQESS